MSITPSLRIQAMNFVRVALDVPLSTLFDYRAQAVTRADVGRRVLVPFGRKIAVGVIIELARTTSLSPQRVRNVLSVLRDIPPLHGVGAREIGHTRLNTQRMELCSCRVLLQ